MSSRGSQRKGTSSCSDSVPNSKTEGPDFKRSPHSLLPRPHPHFIDCETEVKRGKVISQSSPLMLSDKILRSVGGRKEPIFTTLILGSWTHGPLDAAIVLFCSARKLAADNCDPNIHFSSVIWQCRHWTWILTLLLSNHVTMGKSHGVAKIQNHIFKVVRNNDTYFKGFLGGLNKMIWCKMP